MIAITKSTFDTRKFTRWIINVIRTQNRSKHEDKFILLDSLNDEVGLVEDELNFWLFKDERLPKFKTKFF